jgi:hypothetical protein
MIEMIHIETTIEPKNGDEFTALSISFMRKEETNELGESKYVYGGWWQDKEEIKHFFNNEIYINRNLSIMEITAKICLDANKSTINT